jgi:hypothetical protein
MNNTYLKDENLLSLLSLNNMIIPEIQREYVWGKKENKSVLERFLKNIKENCDTCEKCNLAHKKKDINIGFLYSYKPPYVTIDNERYLDEFLIDGQQRFTTLFLLLAYLAVKEKRIKDFVSIIRFDEEKEEINFDYKVRNLTHRFLIDFINSLNKGIDINSIENETWYLSDYKLDVTVQAMIGALNTILEIFNDDCQYFDYILTAVRFWHFKTEATSQGEELYITMNSRGEKLASNEEEKAQILPKEDLPKWGEKWEKWQDFFWKNKKRGTNENAKTNEHAKTNENADNGFNGFLSCIAGLEYYLKDKNHETPQKKIADLLSPEKIENYYESFKYLIDNKDIFKENYSYSDWVDKCLSEIWAIFNKNQTVWYDYKDENKSTEQNRMIFIWSWLYYLSKVKSGTRDINTTELFRLLRFFYIRCHNFNRSVSTLMETVDMILEYGIWNTLDNGIEEETDRKIRTPEEIAKNKLFHNFGEKYIAEHPETKKLYENEEIFKLEEIIWKIEDHPLNINGRDLGNVNISHLVDFSANQSIDTLQAIYDKFKEVFPNEKCNNEFVKDLKSLLLHYTDADGSPFWQKRSYYDNYDCSNWRRIVRGSIFREVFRTLCNDTQITISQMLKNKRKEFFRKKSTVTDIRSIDSWREQLIVYSCLTDIWKYGNIAFYSYPPEDEHRIFQKEAKIYKLKTDFRSSNEELWNSIKERNIDEELHKILTIYV